MKPWFLATALLVAAPAAARSQTVEITPVAGYRFGGGFSTAAGVEPAIPTVDFEVEDAPAFGVHVGVRVAEDGELVKVRLARHLALRLEARGFFTVLESDRESFCGSGEGCLVLAKGSDISQGEVRAGLVLRF